jgi:hypothetical protein
MSKRRNYPYPWNETAVSKEIAKLREFNVIYENGKAIACTCGSKEYKKVYYTRTKACMVCAKCKRDLGDWKGNG